jgi:hypothetical protein
MHTMDVVVFASQKGGSGKTTLSGHVAVAALRADAGPVAIVDTDPQGSLLAWAKARGQTFLTAVRSTGEYLADDLLRLKEQGIKLVIVDTRHPDPAEPARPARRRLHGRYRRGLSQGHGVRRQQRHAACQDHRRRRRRAVAARHRRAGHRASPRRLRRLDDRRPPAGWRASGS